ncbi:helix-turn-helix domain-containing protein [Rhodobaculum claviforme]|nr:helix-turn-helix transcriptional regulator [Rhodobaculum claviforme]
MPIIPETHKALREMRGLSQQRLADRSKISKRTIARIENGKIRPEKVRTHTLESLAKALEVKPPDLCKQMSELSDVDWKEYGYTPLKLLIRDDVRSNYRWVAQHYGVKPNDLIDAAPWMFTLLAELSLAERRRQLEASKAAVHAAFQLVPGHLRHAQAGLFHFEDAESDEEKSLAARDIFGRLVLETDHSADPFNPEETNPFIDFLRRTAAAVDGKAIDPEHLELPYGDGLPEWPVFKTWLDELTGGDDWADFALANLEGMVEDMPDELKREQKTSERVQWLIEQIPAEVKAREEERRAKWGIDLAEIKR